MPRAALELDLVVCRETSKYFVCHNGTEKTVTLHVCGSMRRAR
jgi:hypothetical protein